MTTQTRTASTRMFTPAEWRALRMLRARYRQQRDLYTAQELAHLRFVRWLYQSGDLTP